MYVICTQGRIEVGKDQAPGADSFHIGWFSPSWVPFKRRWWFFRLRLINGFGLTILGFQVSWWRRHRHG